MIDKIIEVSNMSEKEIRKAFINGDYSFIINKVHTSDRITVHDKLSPDTYEDVYKFIIKAIKAYKATSEEKSKEREKELMRSFTKGYDKGYTDGYDKGSKEAMKETVKAFAHMNGDYGEGR